MFNRAMADCDGVGIIVSIDYHGASYDLQTPRLLCKHLTADQAHPVPEELTLAHRLGPDATPAQRFVATAVDDRDVPTPVRGVRTRFRRAGPSPPPADAVRVRPGPPRPSTGQAWPTPWPRSPASRPYHRRRPSTTGPWTWFRPHATARRCRNGRMDWTPNAHAPRGGRRPSCRPRTRRSANANDWRRSRTCAAGGGSRPSRRGSGGWTPPPDRTMRCRRPARFSTIRSWRAACARRPPPRRTTAYGIRAPIVRRTCPGRRRRTGRLRRGRSR